MKDQFNRTIDYLRISLTDRCNLRCRYCMPDGIIPTPHTDLLTYEEILFLCKCAISLGICHFKITGGEPLVRKDAVSFLAKLKELSGTKAVTLTTNGVLLPSCLKELQEIGIDGINISLDAATPSRFHEITGKDCFSQVMDAIYKSAASGIPTKINCVLLPGNEDQLIPLASLAKNLPVDVRFIELMPIGEGAGLTPLSQETARNILLSRWPDLHPISERRGFGPAHYETSADFIGHIGWIDAVSHQFCESCNRIRLTSTGLLKPCLCYGEGLDLRSLLRHDADLDTTLDTTELSKEERITKALADGIFRKPRAHCFLEQDSITEHKKMAEIGG